MASDRDIFTSISKFDESSMPSLFRVNSMAVPAESFAEMSASERPEQSIIVEQSGANYSEKTEAEMVDRRVGER